MCICSVSTGSFLANPHFVFSLSDPDTRDSQSECSVVISLAQKPKNREHRPIGFRVYKVSHHLKHCTVQCALQLTVILKGSLPQR